MPRRSSANAARAAATVIALAATLAGCASGEATIGSDAALTVYVSLPLRGASGPDGRDASDGARLALADAGREAGGIAVEATYLDDTGGSGPGARWTPAQAAANARRASEDSAAIAYLGDFESGASRASVPVTNAARLLQVSPASAAGDLVAPFPGSEELPEAQPSGIRTFGRVIPSDRAQAAAGADWVDRLGVKRVSTVADRSAFGKMMVADFEAALTGAAVVGAGRGLLYYGGGPGGQPAALGRTARRLMVTDADLGRGIGESPGTLATSAALDPSQLPAGGRAFVAAFGKRYHRSPGRYAAYGYAAMAVILDSIDRASDPADRTSVADAFFGAAQPDSVLGPYSIDEHGETTLDRMTGYEIGSGAPRPVADLRSR